MVPGIFLYLIWKGVAAAEYTRKWLVICSESFSLMTSVKISRGRVQNTQLCTKNDLMVRLAWSPHTTGWPPSLVSSSWQRTCLLAHFHVFSYSRWLSGFHVLNHRTHMISEQHLNIPLFPSHKEDEDLLCMFILHIKINISLHIIKDLKITFNMDNKKKFHKRPHKLERQTNGWRNRKRNSSYIVDVKDQWHGAPVSHSVGSLLLPVGPQKHRIIRVGRDLQDHLLHPST